MKAYQTKQIRNIGIIGHGGEGKTTLTEAILYSAGAIDRFGRVEDGTTTTDYDSEEIKRQISISAAVAPIEWKNHKINIIDVPGYFDFIGEMYGALTAADGAIIVIGAVSGVAVGTEKAWDYCKEKEIPRMFFVNQMDRENADYFKVLDELKDKYGTAIAPLQVPIMAGGAFKGYVDILNMTAWEFAGKQPKETSIPDDLMDRVESIREMIVEAAAENDDDLLEKYFSGEELSNEEIRLALRKGIVSADVVPVLCGSALDNAGIQALMDNILEFMPSPEDRPAMVGTNPKSKDMEERIADEKAPFSAQVFKTVADPFVGKLSLFRVFSGTLTTDMSLYNSNKEKTEKINNIFVMRGKKQTAVDKLVAGDIGAIAKLQVTMTGDTICDSAAPIVFDQITFPEPSISLAVNAKNQGEEEKVFTGLYRLEEEDPSFRLEKNTETGDTLISGLGELHIEVITKKLQNKFGVEVVLTDPKIPYRETIRKSVKAEGKHKKQSGGHGQYGHCWIEFEPITDGSADFEFVDKIVGGVVPKQYIPAVEKGLRESMEHGVLAGYPVVGIRCTLYDGSYHSVDSSELAFKIAASLAFKKGCAEADPVLLEPIYRVEVTIPDEYMGEIIGDLNRRRGRILGMNPIDGLQQVIAEVPLAEMFKYATDLRSMTQARGSFTMTFERYEEVPAQNAAKIIEQAKREMEEAE
ncbi:MAG: elongation factor G [Clostridia bacterium]|jgi:elongation factor G